jgi:CelD/BcsL family acetyltransferase involved in cellulose biosynthesis
MALSQNPLIATKIGPEVRSQTPSGTPARPCGFPFLEKEIGISRNRIEQHIKQVIDRGLITRDRRSQLPPPGAKLLAKGFDGLDIYACFNLALPAALWRSFQRRATTTPFQDYDWLSNWHDADVSPSGTKPFIVMVFENDRLRLLAPLAVEKCRFVNRLVWLGHQVNDYNAPLVDPAWLDRLDKNRAQRLWDKITHCAADADYLHLIRHPSRLGAQANPFIGRQPLEYSCAAHYLSLKRDWPQLYAQLRSAKSRRRVREKSRKLAKSGRVVFRRVRGHAQITQNIRTALTWKQNQLDRRGSRNPFANGRYEHLLLRLAKDGGAHDLLRVYVLEIDRKPLAVTVALIKGDTFNLFIPAFDDVAHRNCSPGTIMLINLMELAARAGLATFDFSMGDERYKFDWCDGRLTISYQTETLTPAGALSAAIDRWRIALKRRIKRRPALFDALQTANAHRTRVKQGLRAGKQDFGRRLAALATTASPEPTAETGER